MSIQQSINSMLNTTAGAMVGVKALSKKIQPSVQSSEPTPQVNPYSANALKGWKTRRARQTALQEFALLKESKDIQDSDLKKLLARYQKNLER